MEAMRRYAVTRQELDVRLIELLGPVLRDDDTVLDAACGIGHLLGVIREVNRDCAYVGVDLDAGLIAEATRLAAGDPGARFVTGDALALDVPADISVSWKAMSWFDDFVPMLRSLMATTRRHVFVSSLFYDGDIDFHTRVTVHATAREGRKGDHHYNVYSLPRFEAEARALGARAVHVHRFDIGIDLPRGDPDIMGTYTERLDDGRRVQISGAVLMLWKIIRIDL